MPFFLKVAGQRDGHRRRRRRDHGRRAPHAHGRARHRDRLGDGRPLPARRQRARRSSPSWTRRRRAVRGRATATPTDFPHGWDWTALAAVGEHGALVGTPVADLEVGGSRAAWVGRRTTRTTFDVAAHDDGRGAPARHRRHRRAPASDEPPPGRHRGQRHGGRRHRRLRPRRRRVDLQLDARARTSCDGANEIEAYEVTEVEGRPVLHRLGCDRGNAAGGPIVDLAR